MKSLKQWHSWLTAWLNAWHQRRLSEHKHRFTLPGDWEVAPATEGRHTCVRVMYCSKKGCAAVTIPPDRSVQYLDFCEVRAIFQQEGREYIPHPEVWEVEKRARERAA